MNAPFKRLGLINWAALVSAFCLAYSAMAQTLPTGGTPVAGNLQIGPATANTLAVTQASQRGVIRWSDFSIGQGARVSFTQPNQSAATLNVVYGPAPSALAGTLTANGTVYLVNPNGIAITPSGLVDARGGFVASTLNIRPDDFMAGQNVFEGAGGSVVNRGRILTGQDGFVGLLGSQVSNEGVIQAPLGKVMLGAAQKATLDFNGDGFLQILLPAANGRVDNAGIIQADGGLVVLKANAARDAIRDVVNMPGEIRAQSVSGRQGRIVLESNGGGVQVSGTLDVSAQPEQKNGGLIDITGDQVVLQRATLSATGSEQGGAIRIGGAFQGGKVTSPASSHGERFLSEGDAPLASSRNTTVDAASQIDVSATGANGRGGRVVVWSDEHTTVQGEIRATGAASGGAVEVSSARQILSLAMDRLKLGKGGLLLLDPQDITVDDALPDDPPTASHLSSAQLINQLSTGASVSLLASRDISWDTFAAQAQRPDVNTPAGDLSLVAGRSVVLRGAFTTGDGNWSIVANAPAARGVVDVERTGELPAELNLRDANFIGSNGSLSLTLADGAGNTQRGVDSLYLGSFNGNSLSATIASTAVGEFGTPRIVLTSNIATAGGITLDGNLFAAPVGGSVTLTGSSVNWLGEKNGATLTGEGKLQFFENSFLTRLGVLGSMDDAVRLSLGVNGSSFSRVYGDADPDGSGISKTPLELASHSRAVDPTAADALINAALEPGSLSTSGGPGVTASVGSSSLTVSATNAFAIASVLPENYFIDLSTPVAAPLTITPRTLTPTVSNVSYTYGSPVATVSFSGAVNGDLLAPVATLNGSAGITMNALTGGYGFAATTSAGTSTYTLTGLSGARAGNYNLDLSGAVAGSLDIAKKALIYAVANSGQTYGTLGAMPTASLSGTVEADAVSGTVDLISATHAARLPVGVYAAGVVGLTGAASGNYLIAAAGNQNGNFVVDPKALTWSSSDSSSTYGTLATLNGATLAGVLSGDAVTGLVSAADSGNNPFTLAPQTFAGDYRTIVIGLTGSAAGNYQLSGTGNQPGALTIAPKPLNYIYDNVTSTYGNAPGSMGYPILQGVLAGDAVYVNDHGVYDGSGLRLVPDERTSAGSYALRVNAFDNPNYVPATSGNSGALIIAPRPVSYETQPLSSTYGNEVLLGHATLYGVMPWDTSYVFGQTVLSSGEAPASNLAVGSYPLIIQSLWGTNGNYVLANSGNLSRNLTVTPRALTWSVNSAGSSIYGSIPVADGVVIPGNIVVGDLGNLNFQTAITDNVGVTLTARSPAGSYEERVAGFSGAAAGNYVLANSGNTSGIHIRVPKPITYSQGDANSTYGTLATLPTATLTGVLPGDSVGPGDSKLLISLPLTERLPAGSYGIGIDALTGSGRSNYQLAASAAGTLTVAPKDLVHTGLDVRWNGQRIGNEAVYGDIYYTASDPTFGRGSVQSITPQGVLSGDDVTLRLASPNIPLSSAAAYAVGSYQWSVGPLGGASAQNYRLTLTGAAQHELKIAQLPLTTRLRTRDIEGETSLYITYGDGLQYSLDHSFSINPNIRGPLPGDDLTLPPPQLVTPQGNYLYIPERLNVGTYNIEAPGALRGVDAANYKLANTTSVPVAVQPRPVTVQVQDIRKEYGTTGAIDLGTITSITGVLSGDTLAAEHRFLGNTYLAGQTAVIPERTGVGAYTIEPIGIVGAAASNYRFVSPLENNDSPNSDSRVGWLDIHPRLLGYDSKLSTTFALYGDSITASSGVTRVVPGDDVRLIPYTRPVQTATDTRILNGLDSTPLDAGIYQFAPELLGADARNYVIGDALARALPTGAFPRITVNPRRVTLDSNPLVTEFSKIAKPNVTAGGDGFLPQDVDRFTFNYSDSAGRTVQNDGLNTVGTYAFDIGLTLRSNVKPSNYTFDRENSRLRGNWVIEPLTIDLRTPDLTRTDYGNSVLLADTVRYLYRDATGLKSAAVPLEALVFTQGAYRLDPTFKLEEFNGLYRSRAQLDVGSYNYRVALNAGNGFSQNFRLINDSGRLQVDPRPLTLTLNTDPAIHYGGQFGRLDGVVFNDNVGFYANYRTTGSNDAPQTWLFNPDGTGSLTFGRLSVGSYDFTVPDGAAALTGTKRNNYVMANGSDLARVVTLTPKPLTYRVDDHLVQYGNFSYTEPWRSPGGVGTVRLNGLVSGDDGNVDGRVAILDLTGKPVTIDGKTPRGDYLEVVNGLSGSRAHNYTLAESGNLPGFLTITPAWVSYTTTGAVYVYGPGLYGTPGIATLQLGVNAPGVLLNGEQVSPGRVEARYFGNPNDVLAANFSNLKVGEYHMTLVGLTGKDADNYRIIDPSFKQAGVAAKIGKLNVFSSSNVGLEFVSQPQIPLPDKTYAVAGTIEISIGTTVISAGAEAGASEATTTVLGEADLTASAAARTEALAGFGVLGVKVQIGADGRVELRADYGAGYAFAGAGGEANAGFKAGVTGVEAGAEAKAGVDAGGGTSGSVGDLGDGSVEGQAGVFVFARTGAELGYESGKVTAEVETKVGVGASAGGEGTLSGSVGSVGGGATIYSPGSLGLGADAEAGYAEGELSLSLGLGLNIGIGGLDLDLNVGVNIGGAVEAVSCFFDSCSPPPPPPTPDQLLLNDTLVLANRQNEVQAKLLALLKTSPELADDYIASAEYQYARTELRNIVRRASNSGYKLVINDGQLAYVKY